MSKVKVRDPDKITIYFSPRIRTDGELVLMRIKQGDQEIQLTREQASSLANQINARILP